MTKLINDLSNVLAKHAGAASAQDWIDACKQVMQGYFPANECPAVFDEAQVLQAVDLAFEKHFPVPMVEEKPM